MKVKKRLRKCYKWRKLMDCGSTLAATDGAEVWPRRSSPCTNSGALTDGARLHPGTVVAETSYPMSEIRAADETSYLCQGVRRAAGWLTSPGQVAGGNKPCMPEMRWWQRGAHSARSEGAAMRGCCFVQEVKRTICFVSMLRRLPQHPRSKKARSKDFPVKSVAEGHQRAATVNP